MLSDWLDLTLHERSAAMPEEGSVPFGRYRLLGPGVLELQPHRRLPHARACVFSAGIHGNETAPIELLGELMSQLVAGRLRLGAPILVILGNIPAIQAGQRFLETNLNRLFQRDILANGAETERARQLMDAVDAFYSRHSGLPKLHYDLHTAIRDSRYPRFVVEPYDETAVTGDDQWQWFAAADLQAVLHQHQHSWTFSHYTRHYHQAQSFTLELGRVAPFGANDLIPLRPMQCLLNALAEGREPSGTSPSRMAFFRVEHELMRASEEFRLCFDDDIPNFSEFAPGERLAHDPLTGDFIVGDQPLAVVFPNANVEIGARAALLVVPSQPPPERRHRLRQ